MPISPVERTNSSGLEQAPIRNQKGNANIAHHSTSHATVSKRPKEPEYSYENLYKKYSKVDQVTGKYQVSGIRQEIPLPNISHYWFALRKHVKFSYLRR